jgi:hypothetical protein
MVFAVDVGVAVVGLVAFGGVVVGVGADAVVSVHLD